MAVITLTDADDQRSIEAASGDEVVLRLAENPTTGYRWTVAAVEGDLELVGDAFELGGAPRIGSGGTRVLRFAVRGAVGGRLELKHWQEWEGEGSVTARFRVTVDPDRCP